MAPVPKNSIDHFCHPHPLKPVETDREFLCDGCKTFGAGERYRCHECDFDLHDYCGTCPHLLSSFMHHHSLSLVMRKPQEAQSVYRICDVCRDPVEGLFYMCKECEFDVHPFCTQLPEKLHHALHKIHPLTLQSPLNASFCGVCRNSCNWLRYRCGVCNFDIHLECVLEPVVSCPQHEQQIPFRPPPQFAPYYGPSSPNFGPNYPNSGPGFNMYPQQNHQVGSGGERGLGKSMFYFVGKLGLRVLSNMLFGVDIPAL